MIINGNKLADELAGRLKKEFEKLPHLTVGAVLVGKNPASMSFLKQKSKMAVALGVNFRVFKFNQKITSGRLVKEVLKLNGSKTVNGIIVQLPLPGQINADRILAAVDPKKDIDALSPAPRVLAPTVGAVKFIFEKYKINYKNQGILVIGRGRLVGQPIFNWLSRRTNNVVNIDEEQKGKLQNYTKKADIIISGVGKGGLIRKEMIKSGAVLIDFGFNKRGGKIKGDFDFASCVKKAKLITPVPGGMGPLMVAMLFRNLLKLNNKIRL